MEMNREILFKAKRKDNGEWVEGYYVKFKLEPNTNLSDVIFIPFKTDRNGEWGWIKVDPDTLCQYTGLTDKNGQKIWENDILKAHLDEIYPEDITYTKIIWSECRFCTKENHSSDVETLKKWDGEYFEVCGNIFDNPELLEVV